MEIHEKWNMEENLEEMVDKHGLKKVLSTLEEICYLKKEHVLTNWQDKGLARMWQRNANILCTAENKVEEV